jgi:hypothetical protein
MNAPRPRLVGFESRRGMLLGGRGGEDRRAQLVVGREATVIPEHRVAWGEDECGEAREQLGGRHDDVRGALALVLALVGDAAVLGQA